MKKGVKLLCTADVHFNHDILEKIKSVAKRERVDALIMAGDLPDKASLKNFLDSINIKTFVVHGNWDSEIESENELVSIMKNDVEEFMGYHFVGMDERFFVMSEVLEKIKNIKKEKLIFISHIPPYGILDTTWFGYGIGNVSFLEMLKERAPLLHVFGHVHESYGHVYKDGSLFLNAAFVTSRKVFVVKLPDLRVKEVNII